MTYSKKQLTLFVNFALAIIGTVIADVIDLMFLFPIIFGLGIPLINIKKPWTEKFVIAIVISLICMIIFLFSAFLALSIGSGKGFYVFLISAMSGLLVAILNGIFIDNYKITAKTLLIIFFLSGSSFPVWGFLINIESLKFFTNLDFIRQYGVMNYWMLMTTIGITFGIENSEDN